MSLTKLKAKALKLDLITPLRLFQKLIKKKDVKPISSQPRKIVKKLPPKTRIIILKIKKFNQHKKFDSSASPLKYACV